LAQPEKDQDQIAIRALKEYRSGQYPAAEQDCRKLVSENPSNILAQIYLGQSLYMQKKYSESITPFERARELEAKGMKLNPDQHRIVTDELVIAYGISGNLQKVHTLLSEAIHKDPEYPMNYYNLACANAGEGDKANMLANLSLAFQYKDHLIKGEQMPDPRSDESFRGYFTSLSLAKIRSGPKARGLSQGCASPKFNPSRKAWCASPKFHPGRKVRGLTQCASVSSLPIFAQRGDPELPAAYSRFSGVCR